MERSIAMLARTHSRLPTFVSRSHATLKGTAARSTIGLGVLRFFELIEALALNPLSRALLFERFPVRGNAQLRPRMHDVIFGAIR